MGKTLNFIIGLLIILFFVGIGWTLIKSSAFVNANTSAIVAPTSVQQEVIEEEVEKTPDKSTTAQAEKPLDSTEQGTEEIATSPPEAPQQYNAPAEKEPLDAGSAPAAKQPAKGSFLVIAGAFTKAINAQKELTRLQKLGYTNAASHYLGSTKYLSVIADWAASQKAAEEIVAQLKKQGVSAYIHIRK